MGLFRTSNDNNQAIQDISRKINEMIAETASVQTSLNNISKVNTTTGKVSKGVSTGTPTGLPTTSSYIFDSPFSLTLNKVDLLKTNNLILTNFALDTVQPIQTTSMPQFAKMGIGKAADYSPTNYLLDVAGKGHFGGDLIVDGNLGGTSTAHWDDAYNKRVDTWNAPLLFNNNIASLNYSSSNFAMSGIIFTSKKINASTAVNGFQIADANLGDSFVLTTPQDLQMVASPSFLNLELTGVLTSGSTTGLNSIAGKIGTPSFVSQTRGWQINNAGAADFRYLYTDQLHAKAFIADLEQALAGGQIISKSVAKLALDITFVLSGDYITVESFAGFPNVDVFVSGDLLRVRNFSRTAGSLIIADSYITVNGAPTYSIDGKTQKWHYSFTAGDYTQTIKAGALVIDYGTSANNYAIIEQTTADGLWGSNSPYWQVLTGNPTTGQTPIIRLGKITGILDPDFSPTNLIGSGLYASNAYIKGNIIMSGGSISWANVNKASYNASEVGARDSLWVPKKSDLGAWTTYIDADGIYTGTITLSQINFEPVNSTNIVGTINSSNEGITISTAKLNLTGVLQVGGAATDINNGSTTIDGSSITAGTVTLSQLNFEPVGLTNIVGVINSSNEGLTIDAAKLTLTGVLQVGSATDDINNNTTTQIDGGKIKTGSITALGDVTAGTFNLGSGNFSVDADGLLTAKSATISGNITSGKFSTEVSIHGMGSLTAGIDIYNETTPYMDLYQNGSPYSYRTQIGAAVVSVWETTTGNQVKLMATPWTTSGVYINSVKVLGTQRSAIGNPTDAGSTTAAVVSILNAMRSHGLIAT